MNSRPAIPLLAKMLGWLVLHLVLLGAVFAAFVAWQLRLGLDSLLSGATGERLRSLGELIARDLQANPQPAWPSLLAAESARRGVTIDLWLPLRGPRFEPALEVPANIRRRLDQAMPPVQRPPGPGRPPRPLPELWRAPAPGPPPRHELAPEFRPAPRPPPGSPPGQVDSPAAPRPAVRPLFFARGDGSNGFWAAVALPLDPPPPQPPRHELLLIRSDDLAGGGLFFDLRPWLLGGLAVLVLSLAFWTPVVLGITRYLGQLTRATEQIAEGRFDVRLASRRRDELGRLGRAVERMAARLDQLVTGQKRFLGDIAHELCSPLARLRTSLGILEQRLPPDELGRLAAIDDEAREMAGLIEEILAFSRAGTASRKPQLQAVELRPLVEHCAARECPAQPLTIDIPAGLSAAAEPRLLERAVANILRNSARYAGPNSPIHASATRDGPRIRLALADRGPGVPAAELERLFEPFYRPDSARSRDHGGSGLGLAIVRSCLTACGGTVTARTAPDHGLVVELTLQTPARQQDPTAQTTT
jgi:two-component system sensor histidine kinase CpxA